MLNSLIERGGYTRNRGPILEAVGVTAAALSQYTRGRTRPSFEKLTALADFFNVSLDYLVYGEPMRAPDDHSSIARYVEHAFTDIKSRTSRHSELVARIGRLLVDRIDEVATEILDSRTAGIEGLIGQDEILRMERYCRQADIIATDLSPNVITLASGEALPGQFFNAVTTNLARGCGYRFLLAGEMTIHSDEVRDFRNLIANAVGGDRLNESCAFRTSAMPVQTGMGLYHLDAVTFAVEEPWLFAQFSKFLLNGAWLGYLNSPNDHSSADMLMSPDYTERAHEAFEKLWNSTGVHSIVGSRQS
ncbi:helix-turn-helix domain-containing protein [Actinophytocola algeriensis]|uniref:helix-turn-helix domain-containing protein n=1 Tax=Actinophytocola algeriensis TaxID=1768010 RepID=UPI0019DA834C|nr:helix-turn-helix domain-containing protein [Actinophytocola algeriensis]MBE1477445.1 transcriptional regulator with XRE-family HTH domain [Actinophytocola algeriensis]